MRGFFGGRERAQITKLKTQVTKLQARVKALGGESSAPTSAYPSATNYPSPDSYPRGE